MLIGRLWSSPSLRSSILFGVGGVVFAVANIVLARALPESEYGRVALVFALIQISLALAPVGADAVVIRRQLPARARMLRQVLATSAGVALLMAAVGAALYPLGLFLVVCLALGAAAGGVNAVGAAHYQSRQRYTRSLALIQNQNAVLLLGALLSLALHVPSAGLPTAVLVLGLIVSAYVGWSRLLAGPAPQGDESAFRFSWREGLSLMGIQVVDLLLVQMERVIIPRVLTLDHLATYAILAALAGSPYRILQLGVRYTILPRLSAARTVAERRSLLWREGLLAAAIVAAGSLAVWFLTPLLARWLLAGRYALTPALILATIVAGVLRVAGAISTSIVAALGGTRQLVRLNALSAGSVVLAVAAAAVGARWGIAGVIYGVSLGWASRTLVAAVMAVPYLRRRDGE